MLKLKLLYFQIDMDIQFESFDYSPSQTITQNIDSKFKKVSKEKDFESMLLQEFNYSPIVKNSIFTILKLYIFNFFSNVLVF